VPSLLLAHVATFPLRGALPDSVTAYAALLFTVGFAGIGIAANTRHQVRELV
jgi:hypothetical protein